MLNSSKGHNYFYNDDLTQRLKAQAIRGAGVTVIAQICCHAIQTIGFIILARLLVPSDFGLITMVTVIVLLLQNFGVNGFTEAVIQKENINHQQLNSLFWINLGINILLASFLAILSTFFAGFYNEPKLTFIILIMANSIVINSMATLHLALLKRNMLFYYTSINDIIAVSISNFIAIVLALKGAGYWSLACKYISFPLATTVGAWIFCSWRPGFPSYDTSIKSMVRFAINIYGNFCLTYLQRNFDRICIGKVLGSPPLGHYDRAIQLTSMLPNQLTFPLTNVALATLCRLTNDSIKYRHYLSMIFSMLAFIALPLSAIIAIIGKDLIYFVLGSQWKQAGEIFPILGSSTGIIVLYNIHGWLHISFGRADRWLHWSIVAFVMTIICILIGLPFGLLGISYAYTISFFLLLLPAIGYAAKPGGIKLALFISAVWKYFGAAIVAGLLCWFIMYKIDYSAAFYLRSSVLFRIISASGFYLCLYLILVVALNKSTKPIMQFMAILRDMIPKLK